jgi:hypothetical protein
MTEARLRGLIARLPKGTSEIFLHPAIAGGFDGAADGYGYAAELEGLISASVRGAIEDAGVRLGGFTDFAPVQASPPVMISLAQGAARR